MHRTLLTALLDHTMPVDEVALRSRALGVSLERRHLVGVVVRYASSADVSGAPDDSAAAASAPSPEEMQARLRDLAEAVSEALRDSSLLGLASALDDHTVGTLIALKKPDEIDPALHAFAAALRKLRGSVIIAAGSGVDSLREARRSLMEARQIGYAARHDTRDVAVFRLPHVGLAGLLHLLRDEPRVQTFVERELGPLLAYDAKHPKEQMLRTLRVYLDSGRNKSAAATEAHLSRPAFYERLARIGRILDVDLDAVEPCLSLHVALLALDAIRDV
jgi:purine catabolism regulator